MLAAGKSFRAAFLVLIFCLFCSSGAFGQSADRFSTSRALASQSAFGVWLAKCVTSSARAMGGPRIQDKGEPLAFEPQMTWDANLSSTQSAGCLERTPSLKADNPCRTNASARPNALRAVGCTETEDRVAGELSSLGKAGRKIAGAREEVLEILRSENACSEWFQTKDANAAATFQSLSFLLDRRGPQEVFETKQGYSLVVFRHPYVARTTQDGRAFTAITVNANGAFFRPQGAVQKTVQDGGLLEMDGSRPLTVSSYTGGTLPAQMVTLLHEFGHIIDLLQEDGDGTDGKSSRNTEEVVRHCRSEVETRTLHAKQTAKR